VAETFPGRCAHWTSHDRRDWAVADRSMRYTISVLARDHVGIIADVSEALFNLGGNIEAMSQTTVQRWFTMILCAVFPETVSAAAIQSALETQAGCRVLVSPQDAAAGGSAVRGEPFVATVVGADKPGIVRGLAACFAQNGVNIEDVWNEVRDGRFIVIFHLTVPEDVDPDTLRRQLEQRAAGLDVSLRLQHQDIFAATNSLNVHAQQKRSFPQETQ